MLPHGLLAISIATTFVPEMVRRVRAGDREGFTWWTTSGVRWIGILTIPSSVAIAILSTPIIRTLLEHGHFSSAATHNTGRALAGFAIGLAGFSVYIFALRGFYAHEDTRTPFWINTFENGLNIGLAIPFTHQWGVFGLALSFGVAYMVSAVVVLWMLHVKYRAVDWPRLLSITIQSSLASAAMGAVVWLLLRALTPQSSFAELAQLFLCIGAGLLTYVIGLRILRVPELHNLRSLLPRRSTDMETNL
jgi:putative peptidoglycan lipid II flippase